MVFLPLTRFRQQYKETSFSRIRTRNLAHLIQPSKLQISIRPFRAQKRRVSRPLCGSKTITVSDMRPPLIRIVNGTFYRHHSGPSTPNPPLFSQLSLELSALLPAPQRWCVVGPSHSGKTTFLHMLCGGLLCDPPAARAFPSLAGDDVSPEMRDPQRAIRYVGLDPRKSSGSWMGQTAGTYLGARYESRREATDFTLRNFLFRKTNLNSLTTERRRGLAGRDEDISKTKEESERHTLIDFLFKRLQLDAIVDLPVMFLSHGQGRRAMIARELLAKPKLLLLDDCFLGLDPLTTQGLSSMLGELLTTQSFFLSARPQDPLPSWVTHLIYLTPDFQIASQGEREEVLHEVARARRTHVWGVDRCRLIKDGRHQQGQRVARRSIQAPSTNPGSEALVEMNQCQVIYGDKTVLGNWSYRTPDGVIKGLTWTVRRGERWGVFGPNGSGKTTIISLLTSDHPQAYSLPIKLFGRGRIRGSQLDEDPPSFWDIQSRIGHSSPEIHQNYPRSHSIRRVIENAWAMTFGTKPKLDTAARQRIEAALRHFRPHLQPRWSVYGTDSTAPDEESLAWADECVLGDLSNSAQRVALFLRAIIKNPDLVVLDEAFSGMDEAVRDKCMHFLEHGGRGGLAAYRGLTARQALICIAHVKEEVPDSVRDWLALPDAGSACAACFGRLAGPLRADESSWRDIWGLDGLIKHRENVPHTCINGTGPPSH